MIKQILLILCAFLGFAIAALFVGTALKIGLIPDNYCKKAYVSINQCVPGCVWVLNEPVFEGFSIEEKPLILKGEASCEGRNK